MQGIQKQMLPAVPFFKDKNFMVSTSERISFNPSQFGAVQIHRKMVSLYRLCHILSSLFVMYKNVAFLH